MTGSALAVLDVGSGGWKLPNLLEKGRGSGRGSSGAASDRRLADDGKRLDAQDVVFQGESYIIREGVQREGAPGRLGLEASGFLLSSFFVFLLHFFFIWYLKGFVFDFGGVWGGFWSPKWRQNR